MNKSRALVFNELMAQNQLSNQCKLKDVSPGSVFYMWETGNAMMLWNVSCEMIAFGEALADGRDIGYFVEGQLKTGQFNENRLVWVAYGRDPT